MAPWINTESSAPKLFSCVQKERGKKTTLAENSPMLFVDYEGKNATSTAATTTKRMKSKKEIVISFPRCLLFRRLNRNGNNSEMRFSLLWLFSWRKWTSEPLPIFSMFVSSRAAFLFDFFFRFVNGTWHTTGYHRVTRRREPRSRWNLDTPQDIDETWDLLSLKRSRPREYWFEWCPHLNQWPANRLREMNWKWPFFFAAYLRSCYGKLRNLHVLPKECRAKRPYLLSHCKMLQAGIGLRCLFRSRSRKEKREIVFIILIIFFTLFKDKNF